MCGESRANTYAVEKWSRQLKDNIKMYRKKDYINQVICPSKTVKVGNFVEKKNDLVRNSRTSCFPFFHLSMLRRENEEEDENPSIRLHSFFVFLVFLAIIIILVDLVLFIYVDLWMQFYTTTIASRRISIVTSFPARSQSQHNINHHHSQHQQQ